MRRILLAVVVVAVLLVAVWMAVDSGAERTARADSGRAELPALDVTEPKSRPQRKSGLVVVTDKLTGEPLEAAVVVVHEVSSYDEEPLHLRTDANGHCTFVLDDTGSIRVYARGYVEQDYRGREFDRVTFALERGTARTVTVTNEAGEPIPNAVAYQVPEIRFQGDAKGRIRVTCADWFFVSAPGYLVEPCDPESDHVNLEAAFTLAGRVVDSSGAPVEGATVHVRHGRVPLGRFSKTGLDISGEFAETRTNENGRFLAREIRPGQVDVVIEASGYSNTILRAWSGSDDLEIELYRATSIRLTVVGPTGVAVSQGASFLCETPSGERFKELDPGEASFVMENLTPGEYRFIGASATPDAGLANHPQLHAKFTVMVAEGEHRVTRVTMTERKIQSILLVRVVDSLDRPIDGAMVHVGKIARLTGADGVASVGCTTAIGEPQRVAIFVPDTHQDVAAGGVHRLRTLPIADDSAPVTVKLQKPAMLELEPVDLKGRSLPEELGRIRNRFAVGVGPNRWLVAPGSASTVAIGWGELRDLAPGTHRIVVASAGQIVGRLVDVRGDPVNADGIHAWTWRRFERFADGRDGRFVIDRTMSAQRTHFGKSRDGIPLAVAEVPTRPDWDGNLGDVVVREPVRVSGRVVDHDGKPIGGASIEGVAGLPGWSHGATSSGKDGLFQLRASGMVAHLVVSKLGYGTRVVELAGSGNVVLPIPGRLEVDATVSQCDIGWLRTDGTATWIRRDDGGPYRYDLAPGRYVVETRLDLETGPDFWAPLASLGEATRCEVTIVAGETVRVAAK